MLLPQRWAAASRCCLSTRTSLIEETLQEMDNDPTLASVLKDIKEKGQKRLTLDERKKRRRSLSTTRVPSFWEFVTEQHNCALTRLPTSIFQMNIGLYCNQACNHCHVESSPKRTEQMSFEIADRCLTIIQNSPSVKCVDITGGAPELNPVFRHLVKESRNLGLEVIDRCNLTVLEEPGNCSMLYKLHIPIKYVVPLQLISFMTATYSHVILLQNYMGALL